MVDEATKSSGRTMGCTETAPFGKAGKMHLCSMDSIKRSMSKEVISGQPEERQSLIEIMKIQDPQQVYCEAKED